MEFHFLSDGGGDLWDPPRHAHSVGPVVTELLLEAAPFSDAPAGTDSGEKRL